MAGPVFLSLNFASNSNNTAVCLLDDYIYGMMHNASGIRSRGWDCDLDVSEMFVIIGCPGIYDFKCKIHHLSWLWSFWWKYGLCNMLVYGLHLKNCGSEYKKGNLNAYFSVEFFKIWTTFNYISNLEFFYIHSKIFVH